MSESASPGKRYHLRYLNLFEEDLNQIVDNSSHELENPEVADNLINAVEDTNATTVWKLLNSIHQNGTGSTPSKIFSDCIQYTQRKRGDVQAKTVEPLILR